MKFILGERYYIATRSNVQFELYARLIEIKKDDECEQFIFEVIPGMLVTISDQVIEDIYIWSE